MKDSYERHVFEATVANNAKATATARVAAAAAGPGRGPRPPHLPLDCFLPRVAGSAAMLGGAAMMRGAAAQLQSHWAAAAAAVTLRTDLPGTAQRAFSSDIVTFKNSALRGGPGGRSSVSGIRAVVFGATGFLGRYVVNKLARGGTQCILPVRNEHWEVAHLKQMGDIGQVIIQQDFDIRDPAEIAAHCADANLVINLVGVHQETWNFGFSEVHVDFAKAIAEAAAATPSVERLLHVSCLGASPKAPSQRLQTKYEGERAVKQAFPRATIFRPAPMTGNEDKLFNNIAGMAKRQPFIPLIEGGENKVQPVYVADVADAMYNSLMEPSSVGETYTLCGPKEYTTKQLVNFTFDTIREQGTALYTPQFVAEAVATPRDWLNKRIPPLLTNHMQSADHAKEATLNFVMPAGEPGLAELGVTPTKIDEGLPIEYLRYYRSGGYDLGTVAGGTKL
eukprot:jgi/Tetstr1/422458/TSEL_013296.t1